MPSVIPGFTKTWTIAANNAFTTGSVLPSRDTQNFMVVFVTWLLANGWTLVNNGTGGTAGTPGTYSAINLLWVDYTSFGTATGGNAWIQLNNSTMGLYLLIQQGTAVLAYSFTWKASYTGWSGGSPNAYTPPPAPADLFVCNYQGVVAYPFTYNVLMSCKYHTWKSSDGYVNRFIVYYNNVPVFHFHAEKVVNAIAGFPSAVIGVFDQGSNVNINMCLVAAFNSNDGWFSYFSSAARGLRAALLYVQATSLQTENTVNPLDSNWGIFPVGCGALISAVPYFYFWFSDLWIIGSVLQEGCLLPSAAPYQCVVVGDLLLPWTNIVMQTI